MNRQSLEANATSFSNTVPSDLSACAVIGTRQYDYANDRLAKDAGYIVNAGSFPVWPDTYENSEFLYDDPINEAMCNATIEPLAYYRACSPTLVYCGYLRCRRGSHHFGFCMGN